MDIPRCAYFVCLCRKDSHADSRNTKIMAMEADVFLKNLHRNALQRPVAAVGPFVYYASRIKGEWERIRRFDRRLAFGYALKRQCPGLLLFVNQGKNTDPVEENIEGMGRILEHLRGEVYGVNNEPPRGMRDTDVIYLDMGLAPRPS